MTRKDYVKLAELIRVAKTRFGNIEAIYFIENELMDILKANNPRFDYGRFAGACVSSIMAQENGGK